MGDHSFDCIDAGTENCPCYLALTGDCLICSRLQGKDSCDCQWKGVCIYNEFMQGNGRINNPRMEFPATIVEKTRYLDDLIVFTLDVGKGFALKASRPGSYVFLRGMAAKTFYDTPICVMKTDPERGQISLAVKIISSKTKTLSEEQQTLMVRGIYRNGILGIDAITGKEVRGKKFLIMAKGTGLAPGMLAAKHLWHKNRADWIIDLDKINEDMICDFLGEGDGTIRYLDLLHPESMEELKGIMKEEGYDGVILLASDFYLRQLSRLVEETLPNARIAMSNNFRICCGEGVCGACSVSDQDGKTFKMCKCQGPFFLFPFDGDPEI